jgi:hypothetical protein
VACTRIITIAHDRGPDEHHEIGTPKPLAFRTEQTARDRNIPQHRHFLVRDAFSLLDQTTEHNDLTIVGDDTRLDLPCIENKIGRLDPVVIA